jgi:hypothetical protein
MNQVFETQLQVIQRALIDVVAPALSNAESYVIEQLNLSLALLAFMQQRLPYARSYYRGTIASYIGMADAIIQLLAGNANTMNGNLDLLVAKGKTLLDCPVSDVSDYRQFIGELRAAIAAVTIAAKNSACESALDALVLDQSGPILLQDRIWCMPLGFELRPQDLPEPDWERATQPC